MERRAWHSPTGNHLIIVRFTIFEDDPFIFRDFQICERGVPVGALEFLLAFGFSPSQEVLP